MEEGRGGEGRRRAENRGGRRGKGEGGEEEENKESEGSLTRVGAVEQKQASLDEEVRGRDKRRVCVLLQIAIERLGGPSFSEALQRRGSTGVQGLALRATSGPVRHVRVQEEANKHQTLRPPRLHHGRLRRAYARVAFVCQGCGRLRGLALEHLTRDSPAEQNPARDQEELGQEVLGDVCGDRREEGRLQEVLRAVLEEHQARHPRGFDESGEGCRAHALPHVEVRRRADQSEGVRGPHEGGPERYLLHHWRQRRSGLFLPLLGNVAEEGSGGALHGGPHRRIRSPAAQGIRWEKAEVDYQGRSRR